jgi:hypothetical protein
MEAFKVLGLGSKMAIATKPLSSEESSVIGIIKALHGSITPRLCYRDEDHLDSQQKTEFEDNAKGTGVTIAPSKTQFVVDLQKIGYPHRPPTADQPHSDGVVVFSSLGMKKDSMAVQIHNIEGVKTPIVLDVSWPKQIGLMDVVALQSFCEIRILDTFGDIRSFF